MNTPRDADMVALEEILSAFSKEPELMTGVVEPHRSWSRSSVSTLQGSSHPVRASGLDLEAAIKPALRQEFQSQQDAQILEALPPYHRLPDVKRLASARYYILNKYRRLFSLVFLGNLAAFIWVIIEDQSPLNLINAAGANILALGLSRNPLVINLMFKVFGAIPRSAPLRLRRWCAKIYCYGGVHSGCGIASLVWYIGFIVLLTRNYALERQTKNNLRRPFIITPAMITLSYSVLVLLLTIIIAAYPKIRFRLHDWFEFTHRFCGWAVLVLFWPLLILASHAEAFQTGRTLVHVLVRFPAFWTLILTTAAIIHPWLLLRRVTVNAEHISSHAIRLHFNHTSIRFGQAIQLSKHPLRDWHSFAMFPDIPSHPGTKASMSKDPSFSCLVSKAGDWTSDTINNPPTHLWKRGMPIYGFAHMMRIFSRLIIVTTGSGIGPCLSFLIDPNRPAIRVVWQTKAPLHTYGQRILDMLHQLDTNPVILDTIKTGRVDMLPLVTRLVSEFDAEAVCVISNPTVTKKLVFECESRGIPAYGAIFDS
jgi:hypothetical protein